MILKEFRIWRSKLISSSTKATVTITDFWSVKTKYILLFFFIHVYTIKLFAWIQKSYILSLLKYTMYMSWTPNFTTSPVCHLVSTSLRHHVSAHSRHYITASQYFASLPFPVISQCWALVHSKVVDKRNIVRSLK